MLSNRPSHVCLEVPYLAELPDDSASRKLNVSGNSNETYEIKQSQSLLHATGL